MVNWLSRQRATPWGIVSDETFKPASNMEPLRCPACSLLFEPGFLMQTRCPNCNASWGLKTKRDMLVEDLQISTQGGWNKERLDILTDKNAGSSIFTRDNSVKEVSQVAKDMAARYNHEMKRERDRLARLQAAMTQHSRLNAIRKR